MNRRVALAVALLLVGVLAVVGPCRSRMSASSLAGLGTRAAHRLATPRLAVPPEVAAATNLARRLVVVRAGMPVDAPEVGPDAPGHVRAGEALIRARRYAAAREELNRGMDAEGASVLAYYFRAVAEASEGNKIVALFDAQGAVARDETFLPGRTYAAALATDLDRWDEAERQLAIVNARVPGYAGGLAHTLGAVAAIKEGNPARASREAQVACAAGSEDGCRLRDCLGVACGDSGRFKILAWRELE